ncbi:MAG: phosphatidylserine decarboxylase family protein [Deltaproteobacteria bacterium]|nr:phosphatidylserine decarboxylase family protein [Deltaproteobacteria bacterium]
MARIPITKEGYPFILISLVPVAAACIAGFKWLELIFVPIAAFVVNFFRDPERDIPAGEDAIVSPADGRVIKVERVADERFTGADATRICIFMNVFNVHVNRAPASGRVVKIMYNPGKFFNASYDKAALENEQNCLVVETAKGRRLAFNQIAGLIARRIVCRVSTEDTLVKGERFGMIRFGSRVDVYLPVECESVVRVGDKVKAGSSVIARWV